MNTIKISVKNGMYVATFSDPKVIKLFGSDTISTPYMASTPSSTVLAELKQRNPECIVSLS